MVNYKIDYITADGIRIFERPPKAASCFSKKIAVAFYLGLGLGDNIINKRMICEFIAKAPNSNYLVDLYVKPQGRKYVDALFEKEGFNSVFSVDSLNVLKNYEISFICDYYLKIYQVELAAILQKDYQFAKYIEEIKDSIDEYGLGWNPATNSSVHYARCEKDGRNCYTAYNYIKPFNINDYKVYIPFASAYKRRYEELHLSRYITVNFGWGINPNGKMKLPNKVWPVRYYEKLVELFHQHFPVISVVQIGMNGSIRIKGVNRYVFEESIETIKYVLRDSLLHIDCEGGLVHLATQLGTKCVVFFGPTPVHYFGYEENFNIVSEGCRNCCYLYDDFSVCARGLEEPECMVSIVPEMVMKRVEKYLQKKLEFYTDSNCKLMQKV